MKKRQIRYPQRDSHLRENALTELYQTPSFLSPIWRVIYQEAMRGHDLLFNGDLWQSRELPAAPFTADAKQMAETSCRLMKASNLSEMRRIISCLTQPQRQNLRRLVRLNLCRWQQAHQQSLH
jgi:hypothetical protein